MRFKNRKLISLEFCFCLTMAIILFWPFFVKAESVVLNAPATTCISSAGQVNLTWSSDVINPSYYILKREIGQATTTMGPTTNTFYTDNNITSDKSYAYQIRADGSTGNYFSSGTIAPSLYCPAVLSQPSSACQADGPHVSLSWSPASGAVNRYEIYRDGNKISQTSGTSFDDNQSNNLEGTKTYSYLIRTVWQDGQVRDSQTAVTQAPACPVILTINSSDCATEAPGGPRIVFSWNNLSGVQNYQVYRKAQSEVNFSLLATVTGTNYTDNLAQSLPSYAQDREVFYFVKAIWLTDQKDSTISQVNISQCAPFLTVQSFCQSIPPYPPEMQLSWTATFGASHYNIHRDGSYVGVQVFTPNTSFTDVSPCGSFLSCTSTYQIVGVAGSNNLFSQSVQKSVDCSVAAPPSPAPVLDIPSTYCVSGDSRIYISWTPSNNVAYYTLYRNGVGIMNLLENYYEDSGVQSGYSYIYQVTAFGRGGNFIDSPNTQTVTAVNCMSPSASTLTATPDCESGEPVVNLSWTQTSNTEAYEIWRATTTPTSFFPLMTFVKTAPEFASRTWKDTNVSGATTYYYRVVSKGPTGVSSTNSNTPPFVTTSSCLPIAPVLTITPACQAGNSVMNLSWTDGGANTAYYEIFRQDYMGGNSPYHTVLDPRTTSWPDTGVFPYTNYVYKIDAVGFLGNRVSQGWQPQKTAFNCSVPGLFTLSQPSPPYCQGSYPRTDLSWTSSSNATSYDLIRSINNPFTFSGLTTTSFTDWGFGNALSFNGNNYVDIGNPSSLQITGSLTLTAWINGSSWNPYGADDMIITKSSDAASFQFKGSQDCTGMSTPGNLQDNLLLAITSTGNDWIERCSNTILANNTWYFVAGVYNAAAKTMDVYVNGVLDSGAWYYEGRNSVPSSIYNSSVDVVIGSTHNPSQLFHGLIDEVHVYNRALSAAEIQNLYKNVDIMTGLSGLWHFDEGSGTIASDSSNFGNNGSLVNGPLWVENGLQWQKQYSWQSRAVGPGGSTLSKTTNTDTMPICVPTKPGLVLTSFCNVGLVNMTLRWSFTTETTKYEIYRQGAGLIKTINQGDIEFTSRAWTDTNNGVGLTPQISYTYYVKAIGPTGFTNQSDSISNTTPSCNVPPVPQNLTATFACGSTGNSYPRVNLSWSASTGATSYGIYRNGVPYVTIPGTSHTDTAVTTNLSYFYNVYAIGPGGASVLSSSTPNILVGYCLPSTPSITSPINTNCEAGSPANTISWSDSTPFNTSNYQIFRDTNNSIPGTPIKTIATSSPEFTSRTWKDNSGLAASSRYYYWVRAVGPAGNKTSSSRNITTLGCGIVPAAPTLNLNNIFCENNIPRATISWKSVPNAYSYNLYRTNPDLSQSVYSTRLPLPSSFTDKGSSALSFDGVDDYVNAYSGSSLDDIETQGGGGMTVSAWIFNRVDPASGYPNEIVDKSQGGTGYWAFEVYSSNRLGFRKDYSGNDLNTLSDTNSYSLNSWHHVVLTWTGNPTSATEVKFYVDGSLKGHNYDQNGTDPKVSDSNLNLYISRDNWGGGGYFNGLIDDVRIYNRVLSASEITNQYNGIFGNETGLVGVWHFDEGTGTTTSDQSGNSNDSTLYNGPIWQTDSPNVLKVLPLERSKSYKYKVKSLGISTESGFSNEISFTAPDCAPVKPDLTVTSQCPTGNTELFLDWRDDPNTLYWSIYKKRGTDPYSFLTDISRPQTDFADSNVESGTAYEYFLIAVGSGTSTISDAVTETASFCAPPPPKPVISATSTCYGYNSRSKIKWQTDPTSRTIYYNVLRKNTSLGEIDFSTTSGSVNLPTSTLLYLDPVNEKQNYIYKVEAVGSGTGNSVFSDPSNEITSLECSKLPPFPPNLYLNLVYSVDHRVAVSIGWTDSGNEENYKFFRRVSGESQFAKQKPSLWQKILSYILGKTSLADYEYPLITLVAADNDYIDDGRDLNWVDYTVTDGETYEYQVVASNVNGSTFSNILPVPVPIARPGEFELSGIRLPDYRVYLTWTEALTSFAGGQVTYNILRSTASDFSSPTTTCSVVIDPRECFDNNPPLFDSVYYKAIATNIGGVTESKIVKVGLPAPIWKEIMPW